MTTTVKTSHFYFIQSKLNGYVLDIKGGHAGSNGEIIAFPKKDAGVDNQLWYFTDAGDGSYVIHSKLNNLALDVTESGGAGTKIITYGPTGNPNQKWTLQPQGSYTFIHSALGGNLVMDIQYGDTKPGANLIVWGRKQSGTDNQEWQFVEAFWKLNGEV